MVINVIKNNVTFYFIFIRRKRSYVADDVGLSDNIYLLYKVESIVINNDINNITRNEHPVVLMQRL